MSLVPNRGTRLDVPALLCRLSALAAAIVLATPVLAGAATPRKPVRGYDSHSSSMLGNYWGTPLAPNAPLDPRSATLVRSLVNTVRSTTAAGRPPWISTNVCADRSYTVPATQPVRRIAISNSDAAWRRGLQASFDRVPIPDDAVPSNCSDATIVIMQPSTDRMWELWRARRDASGWHAEWGGATLHASTNPGSFGPSDWTPGAYSWGASGSGMTLFGGVARLAEFQRGRIDHAIALALPQVAAGVWSWPAQRTDGRLTTSDAIPYGARFRLDPAINVDALNVPEATKTLARAAQRYGFVVREQTNWAVAIIAEAVPSGTPNPYLQVFGGYPRRVMEAFPWSSLQLVRMDLRRAPGPPAS